ncbi:MAG: hypothetical protein EBR87_11350, partial [Cytophagia bacterium]|nr:hypothetical protein [Cytophagia bacterium]
MRTIQTKPIKIMQSLSAVVLPENWNNAISTGFDSFDALLGNSGGVNGARYGKVILLSAQSGTGKTRLCLQMLNSMIQHDDSLICGHFTGEQSVESLVIMGKTMGLDFEKNLMADSENEWEIIEKKIVRYKLKVVVIDSFPMLSFERHPDTNKELDTKQKAKKIADFAAEHQICIILLNHTDKKGNRAGRNELMHLVDVAYTMRKKVYDDIKVIEFHSDKMREGSPISRAFPFSGVWDLSMPFELEESTGNETGEANGGKVEMRKT